jgi:hypothetical protein
MDGPFGDMVLEISPTGIRMVDKNGILIPWNFLPTSELLQFTAQDGSFAYGTRHAAPCISGRVAASGSAVVLFVQSRRSSAAFGPGMGGPQNAIIAGAACSAPAGFSEVGPAGYEPYWILSGKIAGDGVTRTSCSHGPANFQDIAINPDADGNFSINFRPNVGGADQDFYIQLKTTGVYHADNTTATVLWASS